MADSPNRTLVCSIVFLDIVEYSKKAVSDQLRLKQAFNAIVGRALEQVAPRDRIVLDTGDGAAITFLGDPEDAMFAALAMRDDFVRAGALPVRMGVNLGPVRLIKDINNQLNIIGDGINVAQRVMSFAGTGELLVSRSFHEVVSCLSSDYGALFVHLGARTDKHVREHDVYSVGSGMHPGRSSGPPPAAPSGGGLRRALTAPGPLGMLRLTYVLAPLVFIAIAATAAQMKLRNIIAAPEPVPAAAPKPAAKPVASAPKAPAAAAKPQAPAAKPGPSRAKAPAGTTSAAVATGKLEFLLIPSGEVIVNGKNLGRAPPLQSLDLPAGSHTVEFRYSTFKPHSQRVELKAGESLRLVHRFKG